MFNNIAVSTDVHVSARHFITFTPVIRVGPTKGERTVGQRMSLRHLFAECLDNECRPDMDIKNAQASRVRQTFGENITGQRVSGRQTMKKFSAATCPVDETLPDSRYYLSARHASATYFLQLLHNVLFQAFFSLCLFQNNFINFYNPTMVFFDNGSCTPDTAL